MHATQLKHRGFNQTQVLAQQLSRFIQRPTKPFYCQKIRETVQQAQLNAATRKKNLAHAFYTKPLPFQHVTLIDDLITTGSTANALARTLKQRGVARVDLWCCAKACLD
jgi:ComF family protein